MIGHAQMYVFPLCSCYSCRVMNAKTGEPRRRALQMRHFFFCFVLAQLGLPSLAGEGGGLEGFRRDVRELPMGRMMGSKVYCFERGFAGRQMYLYTTRHAFLIKPSLFQVSCLRRADNWQRGIFSKYRPTGLSDHSQADCLSHRLIIATKLEDAGWAVGTVARHLSAPAPAPAPCLHLSFMID